MTYSLHEPPLFSRLASSERVLIAGAGGGFDVYAGLPLYFSLRSLGKQVHLASLTFSELLDPDFWLTPGLAAVRPDSQGNDGYFPERVLARWLARQGIDQPVYAFARSGAVPLRAGYLELVRRLDLDAIVLVDGGTDILMRGDEAGVGTPEEDMTSLAAVADLEQVPTRLVVSLGFGIDAHHGISHSHVLENIAALERAGHYLGAVSIPSNSAEGIAYLDAVDDAQVANPRRPSIVNGQIAAAIRGRSGDVQFSEWTRGSELFVNPLMGIYFSFDLRGLASSVGYLDQLRNTHTTHEVGLAIEAYRYDLTLRPRRAFPH